MCSSHSLTPRSGFRQGVHRGTSHTWASGLATRRLGLGTLGIEALPFGSGSGRVLRRSSVDLRKELRGKVRRLLLERSLGSLARVGGHRRRFRLRRSSGDQCLRVLHLRLEPPVRRVRGFLCRLSRRVSRSSVDQCLRVLNLGLEAPVRGWRLCLRGRSSVHKGLGLFDFWLGALLGRHGLRVVCQTTLRLGRRVLGTEAFALPDGGIRRGRGRIRLRSGSLDKVDRFGVADAGAVSVPGAGAR